VDVDVEHARKDVVSGGVDDLRAGPGLEVGGERGDLLAGDSDVAGERAGGSDDVPALDDAVELHGYASAPAYPSVTSYPAR
jgi:hypothetical protein